MTGNHTHPKGVTHHEHQNFRSFQFFLQIFGMACKMEIEGEAEGYKGVVSRAIVKVGTDQVRSNFCAAMDEQMSILQSVKRSFDEKRKEDPEGTCYRMEEIDRQALKGCLSAMACLYVLDNQDETGLNSEDE